LSVHEALLIAAARSDPAAFGPLYEQHVDRIYSYVYHRVGNAHDAEDLTARTFYRALVAIRAYEDQGAPFSAWLYRIARNLVANWHRDQARHLTLPLDGLDAEPSEESVAARTVATEAVATAVRSLDADRQTLLLMKFQGLSNAEIAASIGRSEGAVKSLYHRTLADLRDLLQSTDIRPATTAGGDEGGC
jgi:RNA polymerase sigma-70 factor (ECF subfamily)